MITLIKGEIRMVSMQVSQLRGSEDFTIDSAYYEVEGIQDGTCIVKPSEKIVSFYADTTLSGYEVGKKYVAEFTVTLEEVDKIIKGRVVLYIT